jgi:hypothetical protein
MRERRNTGLPRAHSRAARSADLAPVTVSPRLLRRIFGGADSAGLLSQVETTVYRDEFAIVEIPGAGSAILDLKAGAMVFAVFDLTAQEALAQLEQPGGIERVRAFISEHPKLLPIA